MDVFEAISRRHSYRGPFTERAVPRDDLRAIVDAALKAPSGKNAQTTTFVIVDDPTLIGRIGAMHERNRAMRLARAMIACVVDTHPEPVHEGHNFQVEDCAAAVENMLLAITSLGYATVWIDGWLRANGRANEIGRLLELPEGKVVRILLPIGVPAEKMLPKEKRPFGERAWFNRYGG